jgi:small-conductance mechanosensitive channel
VIKYRISPFNISGVIFILWCIGNGIDAYETNHFFMGYSKLLWLLSIIIIWFCIDLLIQYKLKEKKYKKVITIEIAIIIAIPIIISLIVAVGYLNISKG